MKYTTILLLEKKKSYPQNVSVLDRTVATGKCTQLTFKDGLNMYSIVNTLHCFFLKWNQIAIQTPHYHFFPQFQMIINYAFNYILTMED